MSRFYFEIYLLSLIKAVLKGMPDRGVSFVANKPDMETQSGPSGALLVSTRARNGCPKVLSETCLVLTEDEIHALRLGSLPNIYMYANSLNNKYLIMSKILSCETAKLHI
ncbi:hypothetical protein DYU11_19645 [Fibrisoma montanum]|uniref:Uncharacterized protein n=1 Tax=Fibrisoma montanum TaxID=2305895 RepID=A0A418M6V3_9BACT|nr:hypothetical protein DYU11_19645 [Fibrisoma montanum]